MADFGDTSSYTKGAMPVSMLDIAAKVGGLQQQQQQIQSGGLTIDKQKLDLVNQQFGIMNNELAGLANDPSITKEQAAGRLNTIAKTLNLPPPVVQHMTDELGAAPSVQAFAKNAIVRGMQTMEKVQQLYGQNKTTTDNKQIFSGIEASPMQGGGLHNITQSPIQIAPGTPGYDENNQQQFEQPAGPSGVVPVPRPRPGLAGLTTGPTGPTVETTGGPGSPPATFAQRTDAAFPKPLKAGPSPMFAASQKMLSDDRVAATAKSTALKPLEEAYDIARTIPRTGAGIDTLTKAQSYLTNLGLIKADEKNPAVIYQMLNKNLAQFINNSGSRSDADLAIKESGNANAKTQLQPALLHMAQKIIGREKIEIARPGAFEGSDVGKYSEHSSKFPTSQDERAYTIDKMKPEDAKQLYIEMKNKALNGKGAEQAEGIKFLKSLSIAKKQGLINGIN